jgi:hypothetical protein
VEGRDAPRQPIAFPASIEAVGRTLEAGKALAQCQRTLGANRDRAWNEPGAVALCECGIKESPVSAEEYRRYASECLQLMSATRDHSQRTILLDMAAAWTDLARQAEKNRANDIVYESPPAPSVPLQQQQPQRKADDD